VGDLVKGLGAAQQIKKKKGLKTNMGGGDIWVKKNP